MNWPMELAYYQPAKKQGFRVRSPDFVNAKTRKIENVLTKSDISTWGKKSVKISYCEKNGKKLEIDFFLVIAYFSNFS